MRVAYRQVIALLVVAGLLGGLVVAPNIVVGYLEDVVFNPWFPLVLVGLYTVRPFLAWPITAVSVVVGYRYGLVVGVPIALIGAVGTSLIPYAAARYFRPETGLFGWIADGSERFFAAAGKLRGIVAARLAPTPAEPVSAAAGLGHAPLGAFAVGTLLGELPWTVAAVFAGHSMRRLSISAAAPDPVLVAGGILAAVVILAGPAYRYARQARATAQR